MGARSSESRLVHHSVPTDGHQTEPLINKIKYLPEHDQKAMARPWSQKQMALQERDLDMAPLQWPGDRWYKTDRALDALKVPPPEPPKDLTDSEKTSATDITQDARNYMGAVAANQDSTPGFNKLVGDFACLSKQEMDRLLPEINKQLEKDGLRIAYVPETEEVWLGQKQKSGEYFLMARVAPSDEGSCIST